MNHSSGFVQVFIIAGLVTIAGLLTLLLALSSAGSRHSAALDRTIIGNAIVDVAFARTAEPFVLGKGTFEATEATISGERASISVENDGGKISVLSAPLDLIASYADVVGLDAGAQHALLTDLQALRSHGDGPNAFATLELAFSRRVSADQLRRDFSAVTRIATIDPAVASETVLTAIPDLTDFERADILAARARGEAPPYGLSVHLGEPQPFYSLVVTVHWSETEHFTRRIPFELTASGRMRQLAPPSP